VVLGTNDIGYSKPPPSYYATIRDRIVALGATVVWVDPPSMPNDRLAAVRATIAALGVPVIPPAQIAISSDNIHPTSSGYVDWAGQIWHEVPA
jgi:lysophospholipase L1-like esterase